MRGVRAVWARELGAWCDAPGHWLVAAGFVLALHAAFYFLGYPIGELAMPGLWEGRTASLYALFAWLPPAFAVLVPALCMSAWAEERRSGTEELLLAFPLRAWQAVLGKFLASWCVLALVLAAVLAPAALLVDSLGELDWGASLCGAGGALLLAGSCAAIALCVSAATGEPLVAFLLAALALAGLWSTSLYTRVLPSSLAEGAQALSPYAHFLETAARGLLDARDLVYHATLIAGGLVLNTALVEARRWR